MNLLKSDLAHMWFEKNFQRGVGVHGDNSAGGQRPIFDGLES